jgi:hypothetical protein
MSTTGKLTMDTWRGESFATVMLWKSWNEKVEAQAPFLWLAVWRAYRKARNKGWL